MEGLRALCFTAPPWPDTTGLKTGTFSTLEPSAWVHSKQEPGFSDPRLAWRAAEKLAKHTREAMRSPSDNHLSLASGPCSAYPFRCFSPGRLCRGKRRARKDDVWSSGQVCPLLERKCPQNQPITESRMQFTLCLTLSSWHPFRRVFCEGPFSGHSSSLSFPLHSPGLFCPHSSPEES